MVDKNSGNFSYPAQIGIFLGLIGAGILIGSMASIGIWMAMTGRPLLAIETDILNPKYYNALMWMQAVSTLFMFFLPVYFFALICYQRSFRFMGFNKRISNRQILLVIGILFFTFPLSGALAEVTKMIPIPKDWEIRFKAMEAAREAQEAVLININSFSRYIFSMAIIALLPAVFEEVCFRGGLQNILTRWFNGPWLAIIGTAFIFSFIHMSYYGFLVRFALGIILGLIFYYSGNLWLCIIFHFLYNGIQVTVLYAVNESGKKVPKDIEETFPLWAGLIALIIIVYAFISFRKFSLLQQQKYQLPVSEDPDDFHNWITKEF